MPNRTTQAARPSSAAQRGSGRPSASGTVSGTVSGIAPSPRTAPGSGPEAGPDPTARNALRRVLADWLTDHLTDRTAQTDTPAGTVWYTAAQAAFFRQAKAAGRHPVIVSGERTELSEATRQALRFYRGGWAVRDAAGQLRNGLTGRRINQVE
ncbi:MAG: DUF6177 family protein, partial [Bifidobacteriaceae bacterium]|nr:DUF6177 family protein [Bifidobacteriaceae bacterium]